MNAMLVYMGEEQAGGEDAAIEFLTQHEDLWTLGFLQTLLQKSKLDYN